MSRPLGFSIQLSTERRPRMCDVCTSQEADGWVETFVGGIPQSDLCIECATDVYKIVAGLRMAAARAARSAGASEPEAVAV